MTTSNNVKVVCRFRPLNKLEQQHGGRILSISIDVTTLQLETRELSGRFVFDRVFDESARQSDIFEYSIQTTVDDILNGYNGTILAYGHTGSGKTYTMMGPDIEDPELKGVIPRIVERIFKSIMESQNNIEYTVKVSYMEIYMERIKDLLCPHNDHLPIHEEKNRGVYVKGLREVYVSSLNEIYQIIKKGNQVRAAAATNVNAESSRSHAIFVITVTQKNLETENIKSGQLFLVDLAGSEKVAKTGASGQVLEEAKKINKSLSTLGLVINSLTDGKSTHIPYRDSKLTRILQESLGGNSRTTLIINCSPSLNDESETVSTIRFGMRAKTIRNKAKINQELSSNELKHQLKKAKAQIFAYFEYIVALENELDLWRSGEKVYQEKWTPKMVVDIVKESKVVINNEKNDMIKTTILEKKSVPFIQNAAMEKDERDDFLRRENELQDLIIEKETLLNNQERILKDTEEEILALKEYNSETLKVNEKLTTELNNLRLQLDKITFENKEVHITLDSLKYTNANLVSELNSLKQGFSETKTSMRETTDEQPLKKKKTILEIEGHDVHDTKTVSPKQFLDNLNDLSEISSSNTRVLKERLAEMQTVVSSLESALNDRMNQAENLEKTNSILEHRLKYVEDEYQFLIDRILLKESDQYIKSQEIMFNQKHNIQIYHSLLQANNSNVSSKMDKDEDLKAYNEKFFAIQKNDIFDKDMSIDNLALKNEEFDMMKKFLMKEFQDRRNKVVELEISLNEIRQQYNHILRNNNTKIQRKKMLSLERNLEQLTVIQKQLVEQNAILKREISVAERKLVVRNERIWNLEILLHDAQEKLTNQNLAFERQLQILKERLEKTRAKEYSSSSDLSFGKIAKPLRGGVG
ncbi:hypothetical protein PCK1_001314 [Pneumocystis canis]|nr:hypothetical protein PCK1_001314 [Pneumocystis canis]